MKDAEVNSDVTSKRKSPWRRMYQEVDVTALLHATKKVSRSTQRFSCDSLSESEAALRLLFASSNPGCPEAKKNTNNGESVTLESLEPKQRPDLSRGRQPSLECVPEVRKSIATPPEVERSLCETTHDVANPSNIRNLLFERYLQGMRNVKSRRGVEPENRHELYSSFLVKGKPRKPRQERRHTVSGAGTIDLKEIESWIAHSGSMNHTDGNLSDEDAVMARPQVIRTKLARTRSNESSSLLETDLFSWENNTRESRFSGEKGNREPVKSPTEKGSKLDSNSCFHLSTDRRGADVVWSSTAGKDCEIPSEPLQTLGAIFVRGVNHKTNCFLTPRPYFKNATKQHTSVSWIKTGSQRCSDNDVIDALQKTHLKMETGNEDSEGCTLGTSLISVAVKAADDHQCNHVDTKRQDPRYDTFLDLSKLEINSDETNRTGELSTSNQQHMTPEKETPGILDKNKNQTEQSCTEKDQIISMADSLEAKRSYGISAYDQDLVGGNSSAEKFKTANDKNHLSDDDHLCQNGLNTEASNLNLSNNGDMVGSSQIFQTLDNHDLDVMNCLNDILEKTELFEGPDMLSINAEEFIEDISMNSDTILIAIENASCGQKTDNDGNDWSKPGNYKHLIVSESENLLTQLPENNYVPNTFISPDELSSSEEDSNSDHDYVLPEEDSTNTFPSDVINKTMSLDRNAFKSTNLSQLSRVDNVSSNKSNDFNNLEKRSPQIHSGLQRLFQIALSAVTKDKPEFVKIKDVLNLIESKGIRLSDPRLKESFHRIELEPGGADSSLSFDIFARICEPCFDFIRCILLSQLSVPGFSLLKLRMERIFDSLKTVLETNLESPPNDIEACSNYNVMMRRNKQHDASSISISLCTVDGQRLSFGDRETPHPLNTCATVFNYCLACRQNGSQTMLNYFAKEAEISKMYLSSMPTEENVSNPFTKSRSFLTSTLLYRQVATEKRLGALHDYYGALIGNEPLCCDNLSYNFRRNYAHEEFALAYMLSAEQRLPRGSPSDLSDLLEFHLQSLSTAMTSDACVVGAATLANNGKCPLTGVSVVDTESVKSLLKILQSTTLKGVKSAQEIVGTWDENGSIILIVPGVMGITCFAHCQSFAAIDKVANFLIQELVDNFNFGIYKSLKPPNSVLSSNHNTDDC